MNYHKVSLEKYNFITIEDKMSSFNDNIEIYCTDSDEEYSDDSDDSDEENSDKKRKLVV